MGTIIDDLDSINANLYALTNYIIDDAPSGTITITENGEGIDVSSYATADVNVSGGASVGALVWVSVNNVAPVANESYCFNTSCWPIQTISIGDAVIIDVGNTSATVDKIAAGVIVTTTSTFLEGSEGFYIVDVDAESSIVTGVEQATVTHETVTDGENKALRYTVPEVPSGKALWVKLEEESS